MLVYPTNALYVRNERSPMIRNAVRAAVILAVVLVVVLLAGCSPQVYLLRNSSATVVTSQPAAGSTLSAQAADSTQTTAVKVVPTEK